MRRDIVLSIVHPELYFSSDWEGEDIFFTEKTCEKAIEQLAELVRVCASLEIPIHVHRLLDISSGTSIRNLFLYRTIQNINFMAADLEMLLQGRDSSYSQLRSAYLTRMGVPTIDAVTERSWYPALQSAGFAPLTKSEHHNLVFSYDHAVHFIVGGLFSRCVANYGEYTSALFPSARYFFIDELCIASSEKEHAFAQERISSFGKSISFSDTLKLLQQQII